jgi:hypothetical protein
VKRQGSVSQGKVSSVLSEGDQCFLMRGSKGLLEHLMGLQKHSGFTSFVTDVIWSLIYNHRGETPCTVSLIHT